jgi:hypothetical protein
MRRLADESGWTDIPIVLTNHPKEIIDYSPLERFLNNLLGSENVKFITLRQLSEGIRKEVFPVVRR